jgi:hypothetical protein
MRRAMSCDVSYSSATQIHDDQPKGEARAAGFEDCPQVFAQLAVNAG